MMAGQRESLAGSAGARAGYLFIDNARFLSGTFGTQPLLPFSLAVLLLLRRYWGSWWLGAVLLPLSVIYGINQYALWFPPSCTTAGFGYLFSVWVGCCAPGASGERLIVR